MGIEQHRYQYRPAHLERTWPPPRGVGGWHDPATRAKVARATGFKNTTPSLVNDYLSGRQSPSRVFVDVYERQSWDQADPDWFDAVDYQNAFEQIGTPPASVPREESIDQNTRFLATLLELNDQPTGVAARGYVGSVIDTPDPSPTTVCNVLAALIEDAQTLTTPAHRSTSPLPKPANRGGSRPKRGRQIDWTKELIEVEDAVPGVNDLMSGGVHRRDTAVTRVPRRTKIEPPSPDNAIFCKTNWDAEVKLQPNRVMNAQSLVDEGYFGNKFFQMMPNGFITTVHGLHRALDEVHRRKSYKNNDVWVEALMKRGGRAPYGAQVVYPEHLIPYIGAGQRGHDAEFWANVQKFAWAPEPDIEELIDRGMVNTVVRKRRKTRRKQKSVRTN